MVIGKVKLEVINEDKTINTLVLTNISYVSNIITNCISIPISKIKGFRFYDNDVFYI